MSPDAVDQQGVSRGNVNLDSPHATSDSLNGRDNFLTEPVEEHRVADLDELSRHEAPLIVTADEGDRRANRKSAG